MPPWHAYALTDPRTGAPRYVGTTRHRVAVRLSGHLSAASMNGSRKDAWILSLLADGQKPAIRILEALDTPFARGHAHTVEAHWIGHFLTQGTALLNEHNLLRAFAVWDLPEPSLSPMGRRLLKLIDRRRLTLEQAAEQIGVTTGAVSGWFGNAYRPREDVRPSVERWSEGELAVGDWGPAPPKGGRSKGTEASLFKDKETRAERRARLFGGSTAWGRRQLPRFAAHSTP